MPSSYVCVLHSGNGFYTESLVGNALQCLHAVQLSARAAAPDFIPSIAVFFADPLNGARCVYSSAVPDRNHAVERVAATYPPLADVHGTLFCAEDDVAGRPEEKTTAFAQLFRLRSPLLLQQAVLGAVRKQNASAPVADGVEREGFAAAPASAAPSTVLSSSEEDVWGSLAGALLASLCYLRAHPSSSFSSAGTADTETDVEDEAGSAQVSRSAGKIVLFSDAHANSVPSYSAECALATAVITASKMGVVVSCFGDAVVQADATENRLVGLASSLGGFCAARFALPDMGQLLDGESRRMEGGGGGGGGGRTRQKRDRITSQYVVGPTMLPCTPVSPAAVAHTSLDVPDGKARKLENGPSEAAPCERASHLGWLCPSCMAIIYRGPGETLSAHPSPVEANGQQQSGDDSGVEQVVGPKCPYCCAA